jgi:mannonate dehydratase
MAEPAWRRSIAPRVVGVRIVRARVILTCPGRNYVTLTVETDTGVSGIGDASLAGRELAVASYLSDHVVPQLAGRDPADIEDTWHRLADGSSWRRGPVTTAAVAAVDMALWDIKGKVLDTPVYNLLGGRSRTGILSYAHASGSTIEEVVEDAQRLQAAGFRAIRLQCAAPGRSTQRYLRFVPELFAAARSALGYDVHLLHDVRHQLTPIQAGGLGRRLEDFDPYWLEDAVPSDLQESYRLVRQHTTVPLAVGKAFSSWYDCHQLIREQLVDYVRAAPVHAGGITHLRKIAHAAEPFHVRLGCHGSASTSPVAMAAALHVGLATHNAAIQEYADHPEVTHEVFPHAWRLADGCLHPGDAPGLGVDIDDNLAAQYEYRPACLPVRRHAEETLATW